MESLPPRKLSLRETFPPLSFPVSRTHSHSSNENEKFKRVERERVENLLFSQHLRHVYIHSAPLYPRIASPALDYYLSLRKISYRNDLYEYFTFECEILIVF